MKVSCVTREGIWVCDGSLVCDGSTILCSLFCIPCEYSQFILRCLLSPSHIPGPWLGYRKAHRLKGGFHPGAPRVSARGTGTNQRRIHADGGRLSPKCEETKQVYALSAYPCITILTNIYMAHEDVQDSFIYLIFESVLQPREVDTVSRCWQMLLWCECWCASQFYWELKAQGDGIRRRSLWEVIKSLGQALLNETKALIKEALERELVSSTVGDTIIWKTALTRTSSCQHAGLRLPASRPVRNKCPSSISYPVSGISYSKQTKTEVEWLAVVLHGLWT